MSAFPLSGFKIPKEAVDAAKVASDAAKAAKKDMDLAKAAQTLLQKSKDAIANVGSAQDAAAALLAKQDELQKLLGEKPKKDGLIAIAGAQAQKLDELAKDFGSKDQLVQALDQALAVKASELKALTDLRDAAQAKASSLDLVKAFEKDRTKEPVRNIETDLAKLKTALKDFENSPLAPSQKCLSEFSGLIVGLQSHVDEAAHKSTCNKCQKVNKIPRTDAAKAAVTAKLNQLKELAKLPNDATLATAAEKADYLLAKSIDQMSKTLDENGETAGKMLGALICKAKKPPPDFEVIYGFSGAVWDQQRAVEAESKRAELALQGSPDDQLLKDAVAAAKAKEPAAELADRAANAALASVPDWAKSLDVDNGVMKSLGGATQTMSDLKAIKAKVKGANNIVGSCSAPKMIQQAIAQGLEPVGMAEVWMGGGSNKDGELVASCTTCMTNIGFQLCEVCK